ncbi:hypothetical protein HPB50_014599 [Hyalomma asiaticum]|uniref:Uncharacterized protein n=1 Tax=Hyalomma asiaticum TaxID=266040 RepID=A0ACB7T2L6_HYAAI|nr:hypothetical protein HPB50_014599 [Hyalomma asiaticum]
MEPTLADIERALKASTYTSVIMAGDFNAKHSIWGSQAADSRNTPGGVRGGERNSATERLPVATAVGD